MNASYHTHLIIDTRDSYVDSFTEFHPFCKELYCISNFKDFRTSSLA